MNGSPKKMLEFMEGKDKRFLIPVYQRKYSWKEENCRQLYNDLKKLVGDEDRRTHFFGSIVYSGVANAGNTECQIIDGQQRITTVTLLLLAMCNLLNKGKIRSNRPRLADEIFNTYLVDAYPNNPDDRIKLRPVEDDRDALAKLFDSEDDEHVKGSRLTGNYNYFCTMLKSESSVDALYDAIKRLEIICITLDPGDDAQLIFESLNSTGMALTEGDKIRNYVLMGQPSDRQEYYYKNYWLKIEKLTNDDVGGFVRDFLSVKQQKIPSFKNIYRDFKAYVEETSPSTDVLLEDLLKYARHYSKLLTCVSGTDNADLDACMGRLGRLDMSVTRPFFLAVLELLSEDVLSEGDVLEIFSVTENFLFRRNICDVPTSGLNKLFLNLDREIQRYDGTASDYVSKFIYALESKRGSGLFPTDKDFYDALGTKQIYLMNGTFKDYLFERYQSRMGVGEIDVYDLLDKGEYSIEHVMPQTLTPEWEEELGPDYETVYGTWLHRLANLTLIVHNSNLGNKTFTEKLNDPNGGYKHSGLWMNQWIARQTTWGVRQLEERNDMLREKALEIWKYPVTDFEPARPDEGMCSLSDEGFDLTGRAITKYVYLGVEHKTSKWADMFMDVVRELHRSDESVLSRIASHTGDDPSLEKYISYDSSDLREPLSVDDEIFIELNTSTSFKISLLRRLFEKFEMDPEDLVFYLEA